MYGNSHGRRVGGALAVFMYLSIEEGENAFLALAGELDEEAIQCSGD